jgi:hypothetical protein
VPLPGTSGFGEHLLDNRRLKNRVYKIGRIQVFPQPLRGVEFWGIGWHLVHLQSVPVDGKLWLSWHVRLFA